MLTHLSAALLPALVAGLQIPAKVYPGDLLYPSTAAWAVLNSTVGGNLIATKLPAASCYGSNQNLTACHKAALTSLSFGAIAQDPALIDTPWWGGFGCNAYPSTNTTCQLDNFPNYVVAAKNAQHVSAAVKFAAEHNVRLCVKNTGHDYLGRNLGKGCLSIWTYGLQGVNMTSNWSPSTGLPASRHRARAASGQNAVTFGSASQWAQVYPVVDAAGMTIVGGADGSVGAGGGWAMHGGHGLLANTFGLGVDNVLEHEVVLANGDIVYANADTNSDLFYAMRGGGTTFGITTRVTMKVYPNPAQMASFNITLAPAAGGYIEALAYWLSLTGNFTSYGLVGYPVATPLGYNGFFIAPGKTNAEVLQYLGPIQLKIFGMGAYIQVTGLPFTNANQLSVYGYEQTPVDPRTNYTQPTSTILGSRLLTAEGLSNTTAVAGMLTGLFTNGYVMATYGVLGGQVAANANLSVGLNPAWRTAVMHMIIVDESGAGASGSATVIEAAYDRMQAVAIPLAEPLSANSGAYLNEAAYNEKDPQLTFWGGAERYDILKLIKFKYDPLNVFWCNPCVGSEVFTMGDDGKLYFPL